LPKTVPKDGSTITVWVDGVQVGNLSTAPNVYNQYRVDVATAFPGLNNTGGPGAGEGGPVGAFFLNTAAYANGVHTIYWIATDDAGAADGIGSRYFNILNAGADELKGDRYFGDRYIWDKYFWDTSSPGSASSLGAQRRGDLVVPGHPERSEGSQLAFHTLSEISNLPPSFVPLSVKRGFNLAAPAEVVPPDNYGVYHIDIKEVDLLRISLDPEQSLDNNPPSPPNILLSSRGITRERDDVAITLAVKQTHVYSGYMLVGAELRPLPIGSTLDDRTGTFSWTPGPGFVGAYDLIFVVKDATGSTRAIKVRVKIKPNF